MNSVLHVASPPAKPLMIYDGDCHFCSLWIGRWHHATADQVDYLPFQDPQVTARFPEIPRQQFESAVQLIQPDGTVCSAAEAVFRGLACNPRERWLLDLYEHSPVFARVTEGGYRFVAKHRPFFSFLTRLLWGRHVERPSYQLVRWTFLRCLAVIYLIAFVSLWVQIMGLAGSRGILPVQTRMQVVHRQAAAAKTGLDRYRRFPTLCWFNSSDAFLKFQCGAGTVLAALLLLDIAPAPCLFLLWLIYLSLATVCGVFLAYQWDSLLLESGFLAIFFAPLQWWPRRPSRQAPPSRLVLWLLRWLLFRLLFESGCVKLLSHDPSWRHLTALEYHYETQPLPTWIGWYAFHLPAWLHRCDAAIVFIIELGVPFLIFLPRRPRQIACLAIVFFQSLIMLTGNYGFFNLLAIVLCLLLLDDALLNRWLPEKWRAGKTVSPQPARVPAPQCRWPVPVTLPLLGIVLCCAFVQLFGFFGFRIPGPTPVIAVYNWVQPFRSFNTYGLFAVMTTNRTEILVQGSNDGVNWKTYGFKYKPGNLRRPPGFIEPYQPRLDWQMWFAALGDYRHNPWFVNFCVRLLQGSPEVLSLLGRNPFPYAPPRYIRAVAYDYRFTSLSDRRKTGDWWRRKWKGLYLPPISLNSLEDHRATDSPNPLAAALSPPTFGPVLHFGWYPLLRTASCNSLTPVSPPSNVTVARAPARSTSTSLTPLTPRNAFSTRRAQWSHVMPSTPSSRVSQAAPL